MIFAFTEEQEELRRTVRDLLREIASEDEVRRLMATTAGYDPAAWQLLAEQIGLAGLAIPTQYDGAGGDFVDVGVVLEEMGAALLCAPYLATVVLAAHAVLLAGDDAAAADLLPGIAAGSTLATLAFAEADGRFDPGRTRTTATRHSHGWTLSGTKLFVLDGQAATLLLVAARTGEGVTLFAVDAEAPGVRRTALATLDQTRKQSRIDFSSAPARLVGEEGDGTRVITKVLELAAVGLAAEQVGGAQRVLDMAVDYAKTRMQFGRPIGSFQAIKHRCADLLVEVESSRSAAYHAMWAAADDVAASIAGPDATDGGAPGTELAVAASLAKAYCSDVFVHAAGENIQIHGGIGFTWEHPAHLYFKRAKSSQLLFGDPTHHRELLAQHIA